MAKPIMQKILPYDATVGTKALFSYTGLTPQKITYKIYDGSTLSLIYTGTQTTFTNSRLELNIPGNIKNIEGEEVVSEVKNGNFYCIQSKCENGTKVSSWSDSCYFYCFSNPTFYFSGLSSEETNNISNTELKLNLIYNQTEGEKILRYKFYLYNAQHSLVASSDDIYTGELTYTFRGLTESSYYYVKALGQTQNGIELDTGLYKIYEKYSTPQTFMRVEAVADDAGVVQYSSNIVLIESDDDGDSYSYVDDCIDLRKDKLTYSKGFIISPAKAGEPLKYTMAFKLMNGMFGDLIYFTHMNEDKVATNYVVVSCVDCGDGNCRYKLVATNGLFKYLIYSSAVPVDNKLITVWIENNNGLFDLQFATGNDTVDYSITYTKKIIYHAVSADRSGKYDFSDIKMTTHQTVLLTDLYGIVKGEPQVISAEWVNGRSPSQGISFVQVDDYNWQAEIGSSLLNNLELVVNSNDASYDGYGLKIAQTVRTGDEVYDTSATKQYVIPATTTKTIWEYFTPFDVTAQSCVYAENDYINDAYLVSGTSSRKFEEIAEGVWKLQFNENDNKNQLYIGIRDKNTSSGNTTVVRKYSADGSYDPLVEYKRNFELSLGEMTYYDMKLDYSLINPINKSNIAIGANVNVELYDSDNTKTSTVNANDNVCAWKCNSAVQSYAKVLTSIDKYPFEYLSKQANPFERTINVTSYTKLYLYKLGLLKNHNKVHISAPTTNITGYKFNGETVTYQSSKYDGDYQLSFDEDITYVLSIDDDSLEYIELPANSVVKYYGIAQYETVEKSPIWEKKETQPRYITDDTNASTPTGRWYLSFNDMNYRSDVSIDVSDESQWSLSNAISYDSPIISKSSMAYIVKRTSKVKKSNANIVNTYEIVEKFTPCSGGCVGKYLQEYNGIVDSSTSTYDITTEYGVWFTENEELIYYNGRNTVSIDQ